MICLVELKRLIEGLERKFIICTRRVSKQCISKRLKRSLVYVQEGLKATEYFLNDRISNLETFRNLDQSRCVLSHCCPSRQVGNDFVKSRNAP
jgi:hypothetical protein